MLLSWQNAEGLVWRVCVIMSAQRRRRSGCSRGPQRAQADFWRQALVVDVTLRVETRALRGQALGRSSWCQTLAHQLCNLIPASVCFLYFPYVFSSDDSLFRARGLVETSPGCRDSAGSGVPAARLRLLPLSCLWIFCLGVWGTVCLCLLFWDCVEQPLFLHQGNCCLICLIARIKFGLFLQSCAGTAVALCAVTTVKSFLGDFKPWYCEAEVILSKD